MKSLHKKISAVVLAGLVSSGVFLSSGVSAHAASNKESIAILGKGVLYSYEDVMYYLKESGIKVLAVSNSKEMLDDYIKEKGRFKNRRVREKLLKGIEERYRYGVADSLMYELRGYKNLHKSLFSKGLHRISVGLLQYIIYVK